MVRHHSTESHLASVDSLTCATVYHYLHQMAIPPQSCYVFRNRISPTNELSYRRMLEHALQGALKLTLGGKRTATRKLHSIMRTWGPGLVSLPVTTILNPASNTWLR